MTITLAIVSVSGGKDSTATAQIALEQLGHDRCRFVFADTGNEHEETYTYVHDYLPARLGITIDTVKADFTADMARKRKFIAEKWPGHGVPMEMVERAIQVLQPTGNPFLDLCLWKGRFPSRKAQFCTQELKRRPLDAYIINLLALGHDLESWRGVRRDESQNRKDSVEREKMAEGWTVVHPIVDWTAQQVVDFLVSNAIALNPLYLQGMTRVGCMPCINCNKGELAEIARRFPEHIDRIREWESLVCQASKRGLSTFFCVHEIRNYEGMTDAEIYAMGNIDERVKWSMTTRGGKQLDLEKLLDPPSCSSIYGLCE